MGHATLEDVVASWYITRTHARARTRMQTSAHARARARAHAHMHSRARRYGEVKDCATLPGCETSSTGGMVGHFTAVVRQQAPQRRL